MKNIAWHKIPELLLENVKVPGILKYVQVYIYFFLISVNFFK